MEITELAPFLINGGVAVIVVILMISRKLVAGWAYDAKVEEIVELKEALQEERRATDAALQAAQATKDVLLSLRGRYVE